MARPQLQLMAAWSQHTVAVQLSDVADAVEALYVAVGRVADDDDVMLDVSVLDGEYTLGSTPMVRAWSLRRRPTVELLAGWIRSVAQAPDEWSFDACLH